MTEPHKISSNKRLPTLPPEVYLNIITCHFAAQLNEPYPSRKSIKPLLDVSRVSHDTFRHTRKLIRNDLPLNKAELEALVNSSPEMSAWVKCNRSAESYEKSNTTISIANLESWEEDVANLWDLEMLETTLDELSLKIEGMADRLVRLQDQWVKKCESC